MATHSRIGERVNLISATGEDDYESNLDEAGIVREFFGEQTNRRKTLATVTLAYGDINVTDSEADDGSQQLILATRIKPSIFDGGEDAVFEMRTLISSSDKPPQTTIKAIGPNPVANYKCSAPCVQWTGTTYETQHMLPADTEALNAISEEYTAAIQEFIEDAVEFIKQATVEAPSPSSPTEENADTEARHQQMINDLIHDSSRLWPIITKQYYKETTAEDGEDGDIKEVRWMDVVKKYRSIYTEYFNAHVETRNAIRRFGVIVSVDFYDSDHIVPLDSPPFDHCITMSTQDDMCEEESYKRAIQMGIRFASVKHYGHAAGIAVDQPFPSIQTAVVAYVSSDRTIIPMDRISLGITHSRDSVWPSTLTAVEWTALAKDLCIINDDGELNTDSDMIGKTVYSQSCTDVPSKSEFKLDHWDSKYQAWPTCQMHTTLVHSDREDTKSTAAILNSATGSEPDRPPPPDSSLIITPDHSLITLSIIERAACAHQSHDHVRQSMQIIMEEAKEIAASE